MPIQEILGQLNSFDTGNRLVDYLWLEWYEASKRIFRKKTDKGFDIAAKFMGADHRLQKGDVLYVDEHRLVAVDILPAHCLVITFHDALQLAGLCYEIGNKHLPLFFQNGQLLTPMDKPLYRLLTAHGYEVKQDTRALLYPLKTTVMPHGNESDSLFSKIMKLSGPNE